MPSSGASSGRETRPCPCTKAPQVLSLVDRFVGLHGDPFRGYLYDDEGRLLDCIMFSFNESDTRSMDGHETVLRDGDRVSVMPP